MQSAAPELEYVDRLDAAASLAVGDGSAQGRALNDAAAVSVWAPGAYVEQCAFR